MYHPPFGGRVKRKKRREKGNAASQFEIQTPVCSFHPSRQKFRRVYQAERLETRDMLKFHCFQAKVTILALGVYKQ